MVDGGSMRVLGAVCSYLTLTLRQQNKMADGGSMRVLGAVCSFIRKNVHDKEAHSNKIK